MRDIGVLLFLVTAIVVALRTPWHGVLALAVFSYLNPHTYAWGFMTSFPVYQVVFLAAAGAFLLAPDKQRIPQDWRIPAFYLLWFYFFLTTLSALAGPYAWEKLIEVSKIFLPLIFTLVLINSKEKLYYLIITIAISFGLVATKGGVFAVGTGFSYLVWGPPGTQYFGNNEFAIATLMIVPLLILWQRQTQRKWLKLALLAAIPLSIASAVSSHSRGAFLTLGVLGCLLIWHTKRKWMMVPVLLVGAYFLVGQLPEEWFSRMETIQTYQEDKSAQGRLEAWRDGFNYAIRHPISGSGFNGWIVVTMRDWHSAYVEIMAEHGFLALGLWLSLLYGSILSLTRLAWLVNKTPELNWAYDYCVMLRASLVAYAVGSLFLGISYWDIFYQIVFISVLLRQFVLQEHKALLGDTLATTPTNPPPQRPRLAPTMQSRH